ncbi:MAG: LPS assembly lipoprotein LptE [Chitinophagales bacterium]
MSRKLAILLLTLCTGLFLSGCKIYSFTGANFDPNITSISVAYISNDAEGAPATVGDLLTEALKQKMLTTNIPLQDGNGDLHFKGEIISYRYSIQAPAAGQTSEQKRITMSISITSENRINPEENWTKTFTRFIDFPSNEDLNAVEEQLINSLNTLLVEDVFNKSFVKW